jgi:hypothetical protein
MRPDVLENTIWYLNIAAAVILAARLYSQRLVSIYRPLFLYLVLDILEEALRLVFADDHRMVVVIYAAGEMLKVTVAIFVATGLFRRALVRQPALARFGRSAMGYFFAVAASLAALNLLFGAAAAKYNTVVGRFLEFERSMDLTVMVVLILMSIFLLWFPVRTRRNTAACIAGFVVYSFQRWTGLLLTALWPQYTRQFSTAMLCVSFGCLAAWIVLLRRDGETATVETGHGWNPAQADRLRLQLDAINARLGRLGRENAITGD